MYTVRHCPLFHRAVLLSIWLCTLPTNAQDGTRRSVRLSLPDRTIQAHVRNNHKAIVPLADREYFWCIGQRIMTTQGGFSGDLLDGNYQEFHPNGQLRTKGMLSNGLRTGAWSEWNEAGRLLRVVNWKHGQMHGDVLVMDPAKGETQRTRYKRGELITNKKAKADPTQPEADPKDKKIHKNRKAERLKGDKAAKKTKDKEKAKKKRRSQTEPKKP